MSRNELPVITKVTEKCNGVFGEILQGIGTDNRAFLITAPINRYSEVHFERDSSISEILVTTEKKEKCSEIIRRIIERYSIPEGGYLSVHTQFPTGKGLGSSSADLVAVAKAIDQSYSLNLSPEEIESLIRGIDPTDGVMFSGNVLYYYKEVLIGKKLGQLKNCKVIGCDEGGMIDTVKYNYSDFIFTDQDKEIYDRLLHQASAAIAANDLYSVGQVTTASARLNERFNPKKSLPFFLETVEEFCLPGIICAHSGTYIGFILDCRCPNYPAQLERVCLRLSEVGLKYEEFDMV